MVASTSHILSALNFFMDAILFCYCSSQLLELATISKDLLAISKCT